MQQRTGYEDDWDEPNENVNQASGLVDFYQDQEIDYSEDLNVETVSHTCA